MGYGVPLMPRKLWSPRFSEVQYPTFWTRFYPKKCQLNTQYFELLQNILSADLISLGLSTIKLADQ